MASAILATATAPRLNAQRVEIAAHIGFSAPTGTRFALADSTAGSSAAVRSWNGGGLSVGATAAYWLNTHFGVQGTADLRFMQHRATFDYSCTTSCVPINQVGPVDAATTHLALSLRFTARQRLGDRLQLGAGVGPALIRFDDWEYRSPSAALDPGSPAVGLLASRAAFGVAVGLSAAYVVSPRFRLSVSADDVLYRAQPAGESSWTTVTTPMQHEVTFSMAAAVTVP